MANEIELLCLANSRREGGRCIAGIDLKSGKWVRLAKSDGSPFTLDELSYGDGNSPAVLDKIKVRVLKSKASYYHPENWVVDNQFRWEKIDRISINELPRYSDESATFLFRDKSDRLNAKDITINPLSQSLMLVRKESLIFQKWWTMGRRRPQIRAKFTYGRHEYSLAVTDDKWERIFQSPAGPYWDMGDHPFKGTFYLVIGIGEDFSGYHYKPVVAVITDAKIKMPLYQ
jgi:hypothetical protein